VIWLDWVGVWIGLMKWSKYSILESVWAWLEKWDFRNSCLDLKTYDCIFILGELVILRTFRLWIFEFFNLVNLFNWWLCIEWSGTCKTWSSTGDCATCEIDMFLNSTTKLWQFWNDDQYYFNPTTQLWEGGFESIIYRLSRQLKP